MPNGYMPLYGERRCMICGWWRGQHVCVGDSPGENKQMKCPVQVPYYEDVAYFLPGRRTT